MHALSRFSLSLLTPPTPSLSPFALRRASLSTLARPLQSTSAAAALQFAATVASLEADGDDDDRGVRYIANLRKRVAKPLFGFGVKIAGRFVQNQDRSLAYQRTGKV